MIGIVVVSHSPRLAGDAVALALEMVAGDPPRIEIAAGADAGVIGTDAVKVAHAMEAAAGPDGALVFTDLGSALLSAEMALELVPPDVASRIRLTPAPFVEGLIAAIVLASTDAPLDDVAREAAGALAPKIAHLAPAAGPDAPAGTPPEPVDAIRERMTLVNPDGLHARPAALLVAAASGADATVEVVAPRTGASARLSSPTALLGLGARQGDELEFVAAGPDAAAVLAKVRALVDDGFGEGAETAGPGAGPAAAPSHHGPLGVSPGRAVGAVVRMPAPIAAPASAPTLPAAEREAAAAAAAAAFRAVRQEYLDRAAAAPASRAVLEATAALADDPEVIGRVAARIREQGATAETAVWAEFGALIDAIAGQGGRMAERAADLRDIRDRVIAALRGVAPPGVPAVAGPAVLVARDIAPADAAGLDPAAYVAIVTADGGPTSHTAILARSLGIPAVVAFPGALELPEGRPVFVDGGEGRVIAEPGPELVAAAAAAREAAPEFGGHGATRDGRAVELLANIGSAADVPAAVAAKAQGVGLFRTEFLFLDRETAPSRGEQVEAYRAVLDGFPDRKVVLRTLDAGADKPLPFLSPAHEENPALGLRGYRTSWTSPAVLDDQLSAIAEAAAGSAAEAWVMAPMISTPEEAAEFADRARRAGLGTVGVMIETPSAALLAEQVLRVVDFVSLGTNDLAQYTMAADRVEGALAALNDPWQPAVLRLIGEVGSAATAAGKPAGVCGEAAADPLLGAVLVGLGVTSLSMAPRAMAAVAARLAATGSDACRAAAEAATAARSASEARAAAAAILG